MSEPDWAEVEGRLLALRSKQLRSLASGWFNGSMGGASTKRDMAKTMASQMRHWWRLPEGLGRGRVRNVLADIEGEEARS